MTHELVLVIQSKTSGKFSISLTCSLLDGDASEIIETTSVLGADQIMKELCHAPKIVKYTM